MNHKMLGVSYSTKCTVVCCDEGLAVSVRTVKRMDQEPFKIIQAGLALLEILMHLKSENGRKSWNGSMKQELR